MNTTLSEFNECMSNTPRVDRKRFTQKILAGAKPFLSCLDDNHIKYTVVGSVAREVAHDGSDLDLHLDPRDVRRTLRCATQPVEQIRTTTDTCGLFDHYRTRTENGGTIDVSFHHCSGTIDKWAFFPRLDDSMKDIMFCMNTVLRPTGRKLKTHGDHTISSSLVFAGIHAKQKKV